MNNFKVLMNGIVKENPTFVLLLGMCPTLGTTSSAINGMGMGLATMFVLICSNVVISSIKNLIPDMVRIPAFIVVIASFVTLLQMIMQAYVPALYATLDIKHNKLKLTSLMRDMYVDIPGYGGYKLNAAYSFGVTITKRNYLLHTALLTVLIGIVGGWAYFSINPHHYFGGYPLIPLFFFVFGVFMINMTESCRHRMPGRMLQIYLLMRVMRILVSMIVMLVYCVAVREEARAFLLTFIANYLIYLIYDSWFFFTFEANRKLKKKSNNEKIA